MKATYHEFRNILVERRRKLYVASIQSQLTLRDLLRDQCTQFVKEFKTRFPHLTVAKGFYGHTEHWWLTDIDGTIVDPTKEQFSSPAAYTAFDPQIHKIHMGTCQDCGVDIYALISAGQQFFCDSECETSFRTYLSNAA